MRKLILVFVAIAITAGAYAQSDSLKRQMNQRENNNENQNVQYYEVGNPDGVMMQNGKMMKVKNGQVTILQDSETTMSNGTKIMSDGSYLNKDGRKMKLTEGQHIDMSGNMTSMQTNRDRNMDFNQNRQNNPVENSNREGVMLQNGKIMKVKNGQLSVLEDKDMTLSNGTKIMRDGTYLDKDGKKMKLKEGQHMDMSGNLIPMQTERDRNMYLVPDSTRNKDF